MTLRLMANPKPPKHPAWPGQHLLWCLPVTVTLFIFWEISLPRSQPVGFGRTVGLPPATVFRDYTVQSPATQLS